MSRGLIIHTYMDGFVSIIESEKIMKYKAIIETDDFEDFEFYEDGNGKYLVGYDATGAKNGGWIPLYFTKYENEPDKDTEYEKDLNKLKERILKDGDTVLTKRDLLERFCEVDKEYNGRPWNLLQILNNINILIGEEPSEELDFVQPYKKVSVNLESCADAERR